jgi:hypothetical protein
MGTLKTTNIQSISGSGTVTLGTSGETFTVPSGVTLTNSGTATGFNNPAFMVTLSGTQNITTATWTKILFDSEIYDTNSTFASNKFTPGVAGIYKFELQVTLDDLDDGKNLFLKIYKNGSAEGTSGTRVRAAGTEKTTSWCNWSNSANTTDYYEAYVYHDIGSTEELRNDYSTIWMAQRIGT